MGRECAEGKRGWQSELDRVPKKEKRGENLRWQIGKGKKTKTNRNRTRLAITKRNQSDKGVSGYGKPQMGSEPATVHDQRREMKELLL